MEWQITFVFGMFTGWFARVIASIIINKKLQAKEHER